MNIDAINKTIEAIKKAKPEQVLMQNWFQTKYNQKEWDCKTAACLAGWTVVANGSKILINNCVIGVVGSDPQDTAANMLGISNHMSEQLFLIETSKPLTNSKLVPIVIGDNYHRSISMVRFDNRLTPEQRQQAAINVLEILRDTGEVDWPTAIVKALS